jgi:hypothetical protein
MRVQRGKDELLEPVLTRSDSIAFEFDLMVDINGDQPNFLGKYAQDRKTPGSFTLIREPTQVSTRLAGHDEQNFR